MGNDNAKTILLVDNKPSFRDTVQEFLERHGYNVLVASDPTSAKAVMATEHVMAVVLDVRMMNEEDEEDVSGVILGKQTDPSIPKIFLTAYPAINVVSEIMRPSANGQQPNAAVVDKVEGLDPLLSMIRLALAQLDPQYEAIMRQSFGSSKMLEVKRKMDHSPDESLRLMRKNLAEAAKGLEKQRDDETRRVSQFHTAGLCASVVGIGLIVGTIVSVFLGATKAAFPSLAAGLIFNAVNVWFSKREDKAHERLRKLCERLEETEGDGRLVEMVGIHNNPKDRAKALDKVMDHILQRRSQR